MAVVGKQVAVGTSPAKLNSPSSGAGDPTQGSSLVVIAPAVVSLGGPTVTATAGFVVPASLPVAVDLGTGEDIYAVAASGSVTVQVLEVGV